MNDELPHVSVVRLFPFPLLLPAPVSLLSVGWTSSWGGPCLLTLPVTSLMEIVIIIVRGVYSFLCLSLKTHTTRGPSLSLSPRVSGMLTKFSVLTSFLILKLWIR